MSNSLAMSQFFPGTWDSHVHIIDPSRYSMVPSAAYTPGIHTTWDNVLFEESISATNNTLVQPSIFGNDNTELLRALEGVGPERSRGIVVFDPNVTNSATLTHWNSLGVRGVRVNLGFTEKLPSKSEFAQTLRAYADAIKPFDWLLQTYIPMSFIAEMEDVWPTLGVRVVFDHLGHPDMPDPKDSKPADGPDPYSLDGFQSLVNLLRGGKTWVKVSAPYRLSKTKGPLYTDLDPLIKELFKVAPDHLVYASDWPHVQFEGLDIKPWTLHLRALTGYDTDLTRKVFRVNAKHLWE